MHSAVRDHAIAARGEATNKSISKWIEQILLMEAGLPDKSKKSCGWL